MHSVTLVGDRELVARLAGTTPAVHDALLKKVQFLALKLQGWVVTRKLSGQVLNVRSGNLRRSITQAVDDFGEIGVYGRVYSAGDVKYAGIHEFGGVIHHPGGTPYIIDAAVDGMIKTRFVSAAFPGRVAGVTRPHDIPMPQRSFLRSSLSDMQAEITRDLKATVVGALRAQVMGGPRP